MADEQHRGGTRRRDRGTTLLELLVAIAILGGIGVSVLSALAAAATGAATQRDVAVAQARLGTAADVLGDPSSTYLACDANSTADIVDAYQGVLDAARPDAATAAQVVDVEYWDGADFGADCRYADGHRLQRVTVADRGTVAELTLVKRPDAAPTIDLGPLPSPAGGGGSADVELTPGLDGP